MSGEPHYLSHHDLVYWQSRRQHRSPPGPRPTLGELHRAHPWTWLWCERCQQAPWDWHFSSSSLATSTQPPTLSTTRRDIKVSLRAINFEKG